MTTSVRSLKFPKVDIHVHGGSKCYRAGLEKEGLLETEGLVVYLISLNIEIIHNTIAYSFLQE
jgi:hypothetical protein